MAREYRRVKTISITNHRELPKEKYYLWRWGGLGNVFTIKPYANMSSDSKAALKPSQGHTSTL